MAGKLFVGEEDQTIESKSQCAFRHFLHHDPVGFIGAFERIDPIAVRTRSDDRVYLAASYAHGEFLRLHRGVAANPEYVPSRSSRVVRLACLFLSASAEAAGRTISSPASTRSMSDRSPINLRTGSGNCLTSVGVTTICSA